MYKNYNIIKQQQLNDINAFGTLLTHEKSGAKVVLLKNDDENKSFCIGFRTPPYDDTGLPHILEHSVLCGSRKFPVKEPFVELMKSSLNTFLNAMTFPDKTIYPVASCNDKDFKNLMDVYMDAVLYPNIHSKEEIFKQEGWHYELESENSDLTYNGVVYNEMKGAFSSPDGILDRESLNSLFPDTAYGVESGGNPDFIPTLTYENFKKFHKQYYHPSNSYIVIYGNCDMEDVLCWLDKEYLSSFDKITIDSELTIQKKFDKIQEKKVLYPVSKEQGTENKTLLSYNVALPAKMDSKEKFALDIITKVILNSAGAPLKKKLLESKVGDVIESQFESGILQPVFSICAKNTNEEEKEKFINIIEQSFNQFKEEGLNKKALLAAINNYEFKLREADFRGASKGIIYTINSLSTWLYDDNDPFSMFEYSNAFNYFKENIDTNYFESIIDKYLIQNTHKSIVVCKPSLEIQNIKDKQLKEKLESYKQSLSNEQIQKLIDETIELKKYQASDDKKEDLDTIPLLKKEDLSYDVLPINNNVNIISDIKVIHHDYQTNGIGYIKLLFDAKKVPSKLFKYLGIFSLLLGSLNTKNHTYDTLEQDIMINTGEVKNFIYPLNVGQDVKLFLSYEASALYENIQFSMDIIKEIIMTTDFNMKERVKERLASKLNYLQQSLIGSGHVKALTRALSYSEELSYINDLVDGISAFNTVTDIMKNYEDKFNELVNNMYELSKYIFTKENLLISFTGDSNGFEIFKNCINDFVSNLNIKQENDDLFVYKPLQKNEAFKAPIDVNYVALTGNYKKDNLEYTGALLVFENAISTDYLWKNVRVLGGAYGCMCSFNRHGQAYFVSYRDPNINKTLDVYKGILNYLNEFNPNEEEMIKFIIGAVGAYDFPKSPSIKGKKALFSYFQSLTEEDYKKEKSQIIDATIEDIKKISKYIESIIKQNNICVIGNENKVEEAKDTFKEILPLFK